LFRFGGEELRIAVAHLVFGEPQRIGSVMVALPTYATTAAGVQSETKFVRQG
jgi:hypothetical protein